MKKSPFLWPLLASLALVSCGEKESAPADASTDPAPAGPKTYLIYDPSFTPEVGRVYSDVMENTMSGGQVTLVAQGQEMKGTMKSEDRTETTVKQLEGGSKREIIIAESGSNVMILNGSPTPDSWEPSVLLKEAVIYTKKDGVWEAKLESGTPTEEQEEQLAELVKLKNQNVDQQVYGTDPRAVGETWTSSLSGVSFFGEVESSEGEVTLTLNKVEDCEGQLCAFMTGTMKYDAVVPEDEEGTKGTISLDVEFDYIRSLDQQVDLKGTSKGDMVMNMEFPWGTMKVDSPVTMEASALVK